MQQWSLLFVNGLMLPDKLMAPDCGVTYGLFPQDGSDSERLKFCTRVRDEQIHMKLQQATRPHTTQITVHVAQKAAFVQ